MKGLLPTRLKTATSGDRRRATLVLRSIVIAELAVLACALIFWRIGLDETARNLLWLLPVQASIVALWCVGLWLLLAGHEDHSNGVAAATAILSILIGSAPG